MKFTNAVKGKKNAPDGYDASFTASTPAIDRHETVIPQDNWKLAGFNANSIIGYNHYVWGDEGWMSGKGNPDNVIGKGHAYLNSVGNLQLDVKFDDTVTESGATNEIAQKVKAKVEGGFLTSVSVGFVENTEGRWTDKEGKTVEARDADVYEYGEVELMEVSVVNLPANPEALIMSKDAEIGELQKEIKTFDTLKAKMKDMGEHMETVGQTMSIFPATTNTTGFHAEVDYTEEEEHEEELLIKTVQIGRKRKAQVGARRNNL